MTELLGFRIAIGDEGTRMLRTGVLVVKKLLVVPVSAMARKWQGVAGGPTDEAAKGKDNLEEEHVLIVGII